MLKTGGREGIKEIIDEKRVTLYRMHPNKEHNCFGLIMEGNIPAPAPLKMQDYFSRGFRLKPEEIPFVIENNAKVVADATGELHAVPKGYKLEGYEVELKEPLSEGRYISRGFTTCYRVVEDKPKAKAVWQPKIGDEFLCDICNKPFPSKLALSGHKGGAHPKSK